MTDNTTYQTTLTPLAAYLITEGFKLLDADFTIPHSVAFIFENDSTKLAEAVRSYHTGEAIGNICIFYENYRKLLAKISLGV